jgi:hypothetical protein
MEEKFYNLIKSLKIEAINDFEEGKISKSQLIAVLDDIDYMNEINDREGDTERAITYHNGYRDAYVMMRDK